MTRATGKGHHTDYVKRQYIGNLGKIGIVAVTAYGVVDNITLPLLLVYKPKSASRLWMSTAASQIAAQMMRELQAMGFRFKWC